MAERVELKVPGGSGKGFGRRDVLRGIVAAGAGVAVPSAAADHPVHEHLADHARVAEADARAEAAPAKPAFLDPQQLETLASMAEAIVPGSTEAHVARFVDELLAVDTQDHQRQFVVALGAMDGEARARFGRPWLGLTEAQRVELLTAASTAAPSREPGYWRRGEPPVPTWGPATPATIRDRFDHLKGWVVGAYYSSEVGMRELGWTGNVFFAEFPGCPHPDGHRS